MNRGSDFFSENGLLEKVVGVVFLAKHDDLVVDIVGLFFHKDDGGPFLDLQHITEEGVGQDGFDNGQVHDHIGVAECLEEVEDGQGQIFTAVIEIPDGGKGYIINTKNSWFPISGHQLGNGQYGRVQGDFQLVSHMGIPCFDVYGKQDHLGLVTGQADHGVEFHFQVHTGLDLDHMPVDDSADAPAAGDKTILLQDGKAVPQLSPTDAKFCCQFCFRRQLVGIFKATTSNISQEGVPDAIAVIMRFYQSLSPSFASLRIGYRLKNSAYKIRQSYYIYWAMDGCLSPQTGKNLVNFWVFHYT